MGEAVPLITLSACFQRKTVSSLCGQVVNIEFYVQCADIKAILCHFNSSSGSAIPFAIGLFSLRADFRVERCMAGLSVDRFVAVLEAILFTEPSISRKLQM